MPICGAWVPIERYVPGGYFEELSVDQQLEIMSKIEGLTGLFVL